MNFRKEGEAIKEEVYRYIVRYISEHVYSPNYKEIADELSISVSTVKKHMNELIAAGIIETDAEPGAQRAFRIKNTKVVKKGEKK